MLTGHELKLTYVSKAVSMSVSRSDRILDLGYGKIWESKISEKQYLFCFNSTDKPKILILRMHVRFTIPFRLQNKNKVS